MTAIAGVVHRGRVTLAGDSGLSGGGVTLRSATPKVWTPCLGVAVGYAGGAQGHAILWGRWQPDPPKRDAERWLYCTAAPQLQALVGELEGEEGEAHCDLLLGLCGQLWYWSDGGLDNVGPRCAIGSAEQFVLGVLAGAARNAAGEALARRAVELACEWCDGVRAPVMSVTV